MARELYPKGDKTLEQDRFTPASGMTLAHGPSREETAALYMIPPHQTKPSSQRGAEEDEEKESHPTWLPTPPSQGSSKSTCERIRGAREACPFLATHH